MLKNPAFLFRVKIPYQQFFTFLSFINIFRATSKTWTLILDPEKPVPRKTWTLINLDPEKPGP